MKLQIYTNFLKVILRYFFHDKKVSKKSSRLFSVPFPKMEKEPKDLVDGKCSRTSPFSVTFR